jgi:hypothetical protein
MASPRETVLFLGAGATRPFGIPLTAEILPALLQRLRDRTLFGRGKQARDAATLLGRLLRAFAPGLGRKSIELPLITDLLSVIDHMLATGQAVRPGLGPHELDRLRTLLERGLTEVLAARVEDERRNRRLLSQFTAWIEQLAAGGELTLISTNYDVVVEQSLYTRLERARLASTVDFGVSWYAPNARDPHRRPARPRLRLLKLHGSLDWLRCPLCEHLYIHPARAAFRDSYREIACTCGYRPLRHVIVAPSMVRDIRDSSLLAIWHEAQAALRSAQRWIIIGYSMPPEDVVIRSMFVRALGGRKRRPDVVLVQRGDSREVVNRYRLFVPDLKLVTGGLEGLMGAKGPPSPAPRKRGINIRGGLLKPSTSSPRRPTRGRSRRGSPSRSG